MRLSIPFLLFAFFAIGCGSSGTKHDLSSIQGKVTTGMSELQVTSAIGVPTSIKKEGDVRELRYDSKDGKGYMVVVLKGNVVIDSHMGE